MKVGETIDGLSREGEELYENPHISVWETSPSPHRVYPKKGYKKGQHWYVALNWQRSQRTLTDWMFKEDVDKVAINYGKGLNIPVVQIGALGDMLVLWLPTEESTEEQKQSVKTLQIGKGVISF